MATFMQTPQSKGPHRCLLRLTPLHPHPRSQTLIPFPSLVSARTATPHNIHHATLLHLSTSPLPPFVINSTSDHASAKSTDAVTDERAQCTPYSIPAVSSVQASYPELWATAKIPAADTEARALFQSIEATLNEKLPNAAPKPATGAPGSNYVRIELSV